MKIYLLIIYLFTIANTHGSQTNTIYEADSLVIVGEEYLQNNQFEESKEVFTKALSLYEKEKDFGKIAEVQRKIATLYYYEGNYDEAISFFDSSISSFQEINNLHGEFKSNISIGVVYYTLGKQLEALSYYEDALKIEQFVDDPHLLAILYQNLGSIHSDLGNYQKALEYMKSSLVVNEELGNENTIAKNLNGIGETYSRMDDHTMALDFFSKSLDLSKKLKDEQSQIEVLFNLGSLQVEKGNFEDALTFFDDCLSLSVKNQNKRFQSATLIAMGDVHFQNNSNQLALKLCEEGYILAKEIQAIGIERDACSCLYQTNKAKGSALSALHFYERSNRLSDSLKSKETSKKVLNMEFEKQMLRDSLAHVEKENELKLTHLQEVRQKEKQRNIVLASTAFIVLLAGGLYSRLRFVRRSKAILQQEKDRSEALLLNILPEEIAEELKENGEVQARDFEMASILFTDFESFTQTSALFSPQALVEEINECFKQFDFITEQYGLEKIKTIGDAYMAAGGLPQPNKTTIKQVVLAALDMQEVVKKRWQKNQLQNKPAFSMRLGIHAGPLVAGIVGVKKFQYDVWGDTVNTASRIENSGATGRVNISEVIYRAIQHEPDFTFEYRGYVEVKGKPDMKMYFVEKRKPKRKSTSKKENTEVSLVEIAGRI